MSGGNGAPSCGEIEIRKTLSILGTGVLVAPVAKITGSIRMINQFAVVENITTLVNLTNIYVDAFDGAIAAPITKDGAVISGFSEGSLIFKDQDATQVLTVLNADQVRAYELIVDNKAGKPFTLVQKNGVDTFLRFHMTTTDNPVEFDIEVVLLYEPLSSGSKLEFL